MDMFHRKHHETHTEESIRLSDQAARLAERAQLDDLAENDRKLRSKRVTEVLDPEPPVFLLPDGMPPNPIAPPEVPARKYMLGHDPLCVYRHNQACGCANKEPLP